MATNKDNKIKYGIKNVYYAKVTETVDNENAAGAVYIDGKTWSARSEDGAVIPAGEIVTIVRMEGVKLFVKKEKEI